MIRTENISESEEQRMNKKIFKRAVAMMMAAVLTVGAAFPSSNVFASGSDEEKDTKTLAVYDADVRTDLDEDEVVTAGDIVIAAGYGFDIENDMEGIVYEQEKVAVSYYPDQGSFDADKPGDYDTYYKAEPVSGKDAYLVHRIITVEEIQEKQTDNTEAAPAEDTTETADDEEPAPGSEDTEYIDLDTQIVKGLSIQRAPAAMLKAAPATGTKDGKDSMKVGFSGYAKFCGRSMGVKYISESGDYYHHSVYCLDLNKKTTNGSVSKSSSTKKVKPEITYCLVNGVRELNKICHNSKYSSGHATEDYFITGAAIHVLNGEVKLSYYGKGNTGTYSKISTLVADAKKYSTDDYNDNGLTKSISYSISPAKSKWEKVADGLYRSKEKFVRTKKGTIKNIKYTISGAPAGLTTGEIKTDASKIDDENDLKKYDICVAQTDASKASSNFYLYCNQTAMDKITKNDSTIKVRAKAYSNEKGGSKWTPTVVSQQKITFLEEFIDQKSDEATVKVTSNYKLESFQLHKTDSYKGTPVAGAKYYLYEDSACTDLLCKLNVTNSDGLAASGVEVLTESKYYLKEVKAPDGYQVDENVYEIGLEYFTQYDESGKVTKAGKTFEAKETPETVGVLVQKTDSESGNVVKGAGFAVFKDAACTQRVLMNGDTGAEVPVFYYDEDLDGAASEKFVKQQDVYYVKEVVVPDGYRDDGKVWEVKPDYGSFDTVEMTNTPIRCDVSVDKKDKETSDPQGDARLSGATYGLYALETVNYPDGRGIVSYAGNDNITSTAGTDFYSTGTPANTGALLATVKTDEAGNFNFGNLYYGKYYIQEIEPSEGYLLDETKYEVDYSKEPNTHQNISVTRHVVETVKKQPFEIIKVSTDGDDTETDYVEGAEFTVKLQSEIDKVGWDAAKVYDTLVTDEKGYACSKELPYGTYLVKETKVPHNLYKTDDFTVEVTEDSRTPQRYRILNDAPFKAYIRMVKKDAESGNTICLSGVTFKIRNTDTDEYVEQKVGKDKVSEFTTDDSGTITTPLKLKYGNYQVEEITAPDGYLISEEEFPFVVEKDGAVKVEEDSDGDPVIEVVIQDTPVKGSISITKAGEVLTGTEYDTIVDRIMSAIDQEDRSLDFIYEEQNLAGAVFQLIAAEDIYTPDHQKDENGKRTLEMVNGVPASAGAVVATLTTDENGEASMEDLPLGKYQVVEIEAPKGFVLCEEPFPVELTYKDDHTDVVYGNADFVNERVKTKLSVIKTDGVTKNPVEGATYGVFTKEDILDVNGEVAVKADTMVDTAVTTASGQAIFAADLPLANYYVKEVESPEGYVMDDTVYDVDFTYKDPLTAVLEKEITVEETPIIVEVSKTDITTEKELKGATLEVIDSDGEVYASWVTDGKPHQLEAIPAGDYTLKETASPYGYLIANEVEFTVEETGEIQKVAMSDERVKGAVEIYKTDSKTKSPIKGVEFELRNKDGKVLAKLITDKKGYAKTDLLDIGTYDEEGNFEKDIPYYVVETKAAKGYVIDTTPHEVLLQYDDSAVENVVYTLKLKNKPEKPKLPQTGGGYKPWLFGVAGGFLIGAGIYLNRRRKRRKV